MSWFQNLKISTKLIGGFAVMAIIVGVVGWLGLASTGKLSGLAEDAFKSNFVSLRELKTANIELQMQRLSIREALLAPDMAQKQQRAAACAEHARRLQESLDLYRQTSVLDDAKPLLAQVTVAVESYNAVRERAFALILTGDDKAAYVILNGEGKTAGEAARKALDQLVEILNRDAEGDHKQSVAVADSAQNQMIVVICVGVLMSLGLGLVIARAIANPIRTLAKAADNLAVGDVNVELPAENKDEIGTLATSFRAMADNIRGRSEAAQKIAAGDVSVQVTPKSERDALGHALKKCLDVLNQLMRDMDRMANEHNTGDIDVKIDPQKFEGDYKKVAQGINDMVFGHIAVKKKAMACLAEFGKGNFEAPLEKFPGKTAFINDTFEQVRASLKALIADANTLVDAAVDGRLATRADASKHQGDFRKIVDGVNQTLNTIVGPLNVAIESLDKFAQGEAPETITADYPGEYKRLKDSVNAVTVIVKSRGEQVNYLLTAAMEGNLDARADVSKFAGGNARLIGGVNQLLETIVNPIRDAAAVLDKLAAGDLTAEIQNQYKGDFNRLKQAINTVSIQMRQAMQQIGLNTAALVASSEELNKVSQQMSASADETAAQANVVSAASDQVSKNVQTVATGADEMGASIKEIAKNTADATKVAIAAVKTAETTNQTIEKLGQSSAEIGQVIKVITSIAQQTNLLALNATIEAARAGEAGKGFAVVANEVKELAKETAKATEDISQKIEAIQADTKGAVSAIAQISTVINQINDIQNTIASAVEEQSATTNEISRNLAEAAKGAVDITKNIGGVAEAARSTTAGAVDTQKSAQSLERMASELQELVSQFKYDEQKGSSAKGALASRNKPNGKYVAAVAETYAEAVH